MIIVAAKPLVRATTTPSTTATTAAAPMPMNVATAIEISTSWIPQGALGSSTALRSAGIASSAAV